MSDYFGHASTDDDHIIESPFFASASWTRHLKTSTMSQRQRNSPISGMSRPLSCIH